MIFSAASNSPWNNSVRRQSCASVVSVRITGNLPISPLPKSVSSPRSPPGFAAARRNWPRCSRAAPRSAQHRPAAIDAAGANAGRDILLERLVEGVALAAVETQNRAILRQPAERRVTTPCEIPAACRPPTSGQEAVEIAAAAGGESRARDGQRGENGGEAEQHGGVVPSGGASDGIRGRQ